MSWPTLVEFLAAIRFQHPGWLWAWLPVLLVVTLLLRSQCLGSLARIPALPGAHAYRHPRLDVLRDLQGHVPDRERARGLARRWAAYAWLLLCLHAALAQPYRLGQQLPTPPEYRDTLFVIDTSISMVLRDYLVAGERTDRMTLLKSVLTHFIGELTGNRIGLIVFSERPHTLVPLTEDYALLKSLVRRLEPAVLTGRTSDLGTALLYTLQQVQRMEASESAQKPVVVLVTDVNRTYRDTDPRAVAAYLHERGYRLHTVGIGSSGANVLEPM